MLNLQSKLDNNVKYDSQLSSVKNNTSKHNLQPLSLLLLLLHNDSIWF